MFQTEFWNMFMEKILMTFKCQHNWTLYLWPFVFVQPHWYFKNNFNFQMVLFQNILYIFMVLLFYEYVLDICFSLKYFTKYFTFRGYRSFKQKPYLVLDTFKGYVRSNRYRFESEILFYLRYKLNFNSF